MKDSVETMTTANGLPSNTVHWIIEDNLSSSGCTRSADFRVARTDVDAWIAESEADDSDDDIR